MIIIKRRKLKRESEIVDEMVEKKKIEWPCSDGEDDLFVSVDYFFSLSLCYYDDFAVVAETFVFLIFVYIFD
jgi:hypothetical protein